MREEKDKSRKKGKNTKKKKTSNEEQGVRCYSPRRRDSVQPGVTDQHCRTKQLSSKMKRRKGERKQRPKDGRLDHIPLGFASQ